MVLGPEAGPPRPRLPDPREPAPDTDWVKTRTVGGQQPHRRSRFLLPLAKALVLLGVPLFLLAIWTPGDNAGRWAATGLLSVSLGIVLILASVITPAPPGDDDT